MTFHFFRASKKTIDETPNLQNNRRLISSRYWCKKDKGTTKPEAKELQNVTDSNSSLSNNLLESEVYSASPVSNSSQSSVVQESRIEILADSEISINEPFPLETLEQLSTNEEINIIKNLLKLLGISRKFVRTIIKLLKKNKKLLLSLIQICLVCLCGYYTMLLLYQTIMPFLISALRTLKEKISLEKAKLKERFNNTDKSEKSKEFWDENLGSLSQILKINRGGSFVAIREANIYAFSELDWQQALLSVSPIPAYILFERSKLELEKFIVGSGQKRFSLNTLKEFPSKLGKCLSKLKKLIPLEKILIGISLFLLINTGTINSTRISNVPNTPIMLSSPVTVRVVRPILEFQSSETRVKDSQMIELSQTETKNPVKTTSRLVSKTRVRKRAKLVQLSDLPPLSEQDFDREIDSITIPTPIRIRLN
jgi:hypothetical protein